MVLAILLSGCLEFDHPYKVLAPGIWRGQLQLIPKVTIKERRDAALSTEPELSEGKLPFVFEVFNPTSDSIYIEIINGDERIPVKDIQYGRNPETARDTIRINFPIYDTYLTADIDGNKMDGFWTVKSRKNYKIPFSARYGKNYRFTTLKKKPVMDISGLWPALFDEGEDQYSAIGAFQQKGNHLSGTFMTETGDYRFLEGTVQDDKMYLSAFDGSHAFLFEGKINPADSTITGGFRSGKHYQTSWTAKMNNHAGLKDPEKLVQTKDTLTPVYLELPRPDGQQWSLDDPSLAGKPVILQIMGTWCPNCRDEGAFLADYLKHHPKTPVQVIGLAFEKYDDPNHSMAVINNYQKILKIPYPIVLAGKPKKENVLSLFPQLDNFRAYPTMIFLDKEHRIVKVHTGFNGPATPEYDHFKKEFEIIIRSLSQ